MKEVIIRIPEKKLAFFKELISQLGFEVFEQIDIPEEHKAIVRERIQTAKAEERVPWKEARKQLSYKDKA